MAIQVKIFGTVVLLLGLGLAFAFSAGPEDSREEDGPGAASSLKQIDPLGNHLLPAVRKTYEEIFPDHRIWRVVESGRGEAAKYELTIFDPDSTVMHGHSVEGKHITTLRNFQLVLNHRGELICEEMHPISEKAVPQMVRDAFEKWRRPFRRSNDFVWIAQQDEGSERLYTARVTLNSIEEYEATLKADGTFVKKHTRFQDSN